MADDLPIHDHLTIPGHELSIETMRSGGPGGQHANTADTAVRLRWAIDANRSIHPAARRRVKEAFPSAVTQEGELVVVARNRRSQTMNLDEARERLVDMVKAHLRPPKRRRKTKPTRASQRRRMDSKSKRGKRKKLRGRVKDW